VVKEQIESLGGKFVGVDSAKKTRQTASGYAKELSADFYTKQSRADQTAVCSVRTTS
jgi:NAD/NADP transhydrogenase alpha subunit